MPNFDYECKCGEITERTCKAGAAPKKIKCPECARQAGRKWVAPAAHCQYSYMDKVNGHPRFNRGKGRR